MIISLDEIKKYIYLPSDVTKIAEDFSLHVAEVEQVLEKDGSFYLDIDNKSLTHRSDLWSYWGILREFACLYEQNYEEFKINIRESSQDIQVDVKDTICLDYALMKVKLKSLNQEKYESIKEFLSCHEIGSINPLSDILTYVTLITGMPLVAYPLVKKISLTNQSGIINNASFENKLVVSSDDKLLSLAGVKALSLGDEEDVLVELANYDSTYVRKTAHVIKERNQNTMRYEKQIDSQLLKKAASFLKIVLNEVFNAKSNFKIYKQQIKKKKVIHFDFNKAQSLLSYPLREKQVENIFSSLGFKYSSKKVTVPSYRLDVNIFADLVEELGRMIGYNNIDAKAPVLPLSFPKVDAKRKIEDFLLIKGADQVMTYPIVSKSLMTKFKYDEGPKLLNPQSSKQTCMRTSLYPQHIDLLKRNSKKHCLFEIGRVYSPEESVLSMAFYKYSIEEVLNIVENLYEYLSLDCKLKEDAHPLGDKVWRSKSLEILSLKDQYLKKYNFHGTVILFSCKISDLLSEAMVFSSYKKDI